MVSDSTFCGNAPDDLGGTWVDNGGNVFCCPGDVDGSGCVGVEDLLLLLGAWGPCPECPEDVDGSGTVDTGDLVAVLQEWGPCP